MTVLMIRALMNQYPLKQQDRKIAKIVSFNVATEKNWK